MNLTDRPDISVIMPVFNGERYVARAVLSILVQTYENFEVILIDDGSTDRTADIIASIKDPRLKFFKQKNMGLTKSLNRALSMAKGKWIARHDADDFSIRTRFVQQINYLQNHPTIGLLGTSCFIQPEKYGIINEIYHFPVKYKDILNAFPEFNPFVHGSMMIKKKLLEDHGGYNEGYRYVQDYELWSRLLRKTEARNLAAPLYVRTIHEAASEVCVGKEPIFNEIRDNYLNRQGSEMSVEKHRGFVKPLKKTSFYPIITRANNWNRDIADSLYRMSCSARNHGVPWCGLWLQSKLYWPWNFQAREKNA